MMETNQQSQQNDSHVYELAFFLMPTIGEENLPTVFGDLKNMLSKSGAVFISEDFPKLLPLAYSIDKIIEHKRQVFNTAFLGWVKFEIESGHLLNLKEELKHSVNLMRFIIVCTVRESTLAPRRLHASRRRSAPDKVRPAEPAIPIDEEAVDKKIEELVTD
ncbi:hypothetical protein A3I25_01625 [Candidatus Nomurabacteria bacterium RIFCSPLOWO2_02_FULL_42_17]|uniref:Small ribosomal subunit protein bS6 n=2 Tax=Candidatus Nomuraibacteriota TaxID=1752729 RepID=A0A1F6WJ15_9BACT|nr:MAG: hypothetical protein UV08_C0012G0025 [Parcubacteria group bacterium GW2011_GWA2_42_18]OGI81705.1 MAG: hypothetical protein A3B93_00850 [Candidatus Nomurabacteria bacterium RIFCSPHIGHO2_02_FULL_42_24]OGI97323.1 MAG: hypothetical protein A3I25_01625 [Candidatus Nomurabacteria bacterium RIFCSPLOWO2_02_FULL_42_17]